VSFGSSTVNRATFYDHYTDKFALFDAMVANDFRKMLQDPAVKERFAQLAFTPVGDSREAGLRPGR